MSPLDPQQVLLFGVFLKLMHEQPLTPQDLNLFTAFLQNAKFVIAQTTQEERIGAIEQFRATLQQLSQAAGGKQ